ncbi:hypothetical protein [Streptomyces sp. NPDC101455]|uniref:hypothetical protein n=1 Tax=Streptomyces sp. NPDC101455 TaxID=3366142 RepID=UPI00381CA5D8
MTRRLAHLDQLEGRAQKQHDALAEHAGQSMATFICRVFRDVGLTPEQQARADEAVPRWLAVMQRELSDGSTP